jgi:acyl carrier protein
MKSVRDQVYDIVSSSLEVRRETIQPTSTWKDYDADSFAIVEMILAVQEHFGIWFDTAELENVNSAGELVSAVERKLKGS